jgi:hypothetical protein
MPLREPSTANDASRQSHEPVTAQVSAPRAEPRRIPQERPAARIEPERDDIQIHIGRIEVIALPPPATRAPKAPDRSLSLDAYLNRRNRGSR